MKMPEPITAPIPSAVRLQGPRVLASRLPGSSDAAISASMLLVRSRWDTRPPVSLPFPLALGCSRDLLLQRSARYSGGALGFRRRLLARRPLQFLPFRPIYRFCIHQSLFSPAYFSTSFLSPYPGKLTVSLASSPSPSRRTITPRPYLGCSTVDPDFRGACGFSGLGGAAGAGGVCRGGWAGPPALIPRSAKNCGMFSRAL